MEKTKQDITTLGNNLASTTRSIRVQPYSQQQTGDMGPHNKSLLEYKAIGNLKALGDNKGVFREWNDVVKTP